MTRLDPVDVSFAAAAALGLAVQLALAGTPWFLPAILGLILVLGMPHGGLDVSLARSLWPIRSASRLALFFLGYVALAGLVVGAWLAVPGAALTAFLAYSALHFADDWKEGTSRVASIAAGATVLGLPALLHPDRVAELFGALGADTPAIAEWLAAAGAGAGVLFVALARGAPGMIARMAILAALAAILSPLAYFFVYFCGLHGTRHMRDSFRELGLGWRAGLVETTWPTIGALAAAGAATAALLSTSVELDGALMRGVFVTFAALTAPHMILVDAFRSRSGAEGEGRKLRSG